MNSKDDRVPILAPEPDVYREPLRESFPDVPGASCSRYEELERELRSRTSWIRREATDAVKQPAQGVGK